MRAEIEEHGLIWYYKEGTNEFDQLFYDDNQTKVVVNGSIDDAKNLVEKYVLNKYVFQEWKKYVVKVSNIDLLLSLADSEVKVFFGGHEAEYDKHGDYWFYYYRNYVGKSEIKVVIKNRFPIILGIEIRSPKLHINVNQENDKLFYPIFCDRLITSLRNYELRLSFEASSPTFLSTEIVPFPPDPFILFKQILLNQKQIREGTSTILMSPHRELISERVYVNLDEVEHVTPETCLAILHNPEEFVKVKSLDIPLSSKLRGFLPNTVLQHRNIETFNTPENRFVKVFIKNLLLSMKRIEDLFSTDAKLQQELDRKKNEWMELKITLEDAVFTPVFLEVDDSSTYTNFTSQVLLKKEGYREILQAHNNLLLSRAPLFLHLQEMINQRNIATLYEFWCFFELAKRLAKQQNIPEKDIKNVIPTSLAKGLAESKTRSTIGEYQLVFIKKFQGSSGSYSVTLKPDFSLMKNNQVFAIFDAKFRFDITELEREDSQIEESEKNALQTANPERIAKISDIYKMHTYKDALQAKSSIVLYPGTKNLFFTQKDKQRIKNYEEIWDRILAHEKGVGYLSFVPQ